MEAEPETQQANPSVLNPVDSALGQGRPQPRRGMIVIESNPSQAWGPTEDGEVHIYDGGELINIHAHDTRSYSFLKFFCEKNPIFLMPTPSSISISSHDSPSGIYVATSEQAISVRDYALTVGFQVVVGADRACRPYSDR